MISFEEFKEQAGGRNAIVMEAVKDGAPHVNGTFLDKGTQVDVAIKRGYAYLKSEYYKPTDFVVTGQEAKSLNAHLKKEKAADLGSDNKTVKTKK